jgi:hypothetical protein
MMIWTTVNCFLTTRFVQLYEKSNSIVLIGIGQISVSKSCETMDYGALWDSRSPHILGTYITLWFTF